ncbi:MAG: hypothetical protein ABIM89_07780 [Mycobacteriales bacterium]
MRWEALFSDLEAEFAAAEAVEADAELRDRVRRETALLRLADRLAPARGSDLAVHVAADVIRGSLTDAGVDWLLLAESPARDALIPVRAVASVTGLGRMSATPGFEGRVGTKLTLAYALRGIARDRTGVAVVLMDGTTCSGTIDRVGADFIEIAEHPASEPRRAASVSGVRTVPQSAIVVVRSV